MSVASKRRSRPFRLSTQRLRRRDTLPSPCGRIQRPTSTVSPKFSVTMKTLSNKRRQQSKKKPRKTLLRLRRRLTERLPLSRSNSVPKLSKKSEQSMTK